MVSYLFFCQLFYTYIIEWIKSKVILETCLLTKVIFWFVLNNLKSHVQWNRRRNQQRGIGGTANLQIYDWSCKGTCPLAMEESLEFSRKLCDQHHRWILVPQEHILYEVPDRQLQILSATNIDYTQSHLFETYT